MLGQENFSTAPRYSAKMLYVYLSLHKPMTLAFLDLPVTGNQRSSPWSRSTRRELRDQAHLIMYNKLAQPSKETPCATESSNAHRSALAAQVSNDTSGKNMQLLKEQDACTDYLPQVHAIIEAERNCPPMWKQRETSKLVRTLRSSSIRFTDSSRNLMFSAVYIELRKLLQELREGIRSRRTYALEVLSDLGHRCFSRPK